MLVQVDIKRPNGNIDTVDVSSMYNALNPITFAKIKTDTMNAGRGEPLRYRNIDNTEEYALTDLDRVDQDYSKIIKMQSRGY